MKQRHIIYMLITGGLLFCLATACGNSRTEITANPSGPNGDTPVLPGEIFIVDQTGKRWEVSHAAAEYGMQPERFQFGLGPNAIRPINDPNLIGPGHEDYPPRDASYPVLGTDIGGDVRAYRIDHMSRHEVVNDVIGGAYVAPAY